MMGLDGEEALTTWADIVESPPPPPNDNGQAEQQLFRLLGRQPEMLAVVGSVFKWFPGTVVRVAFLTDQSVANERELFTKIEAVASEWVAPHPDHTGGLSIKLVFRDDDNNFLRWSRNDRNYKAEVRVFCGNANSSPAAWSYVGNQAVSIDYAKPSEPSMSLQGASQVLDDLDFQRIVRHEFGHALGFAHELQDPDGFYHGAIYIEPEEGYVTTLDEERKEFLPDRRGRSPGAKLWLTNSPNWMTIKDFEDNFESLVTHREYKTFAIDKYSIMKYYLPRFTFRDTAFYSDKNYTISEIDIRAMYHTYSANSESIDSLANNKSIALYQLESLGRSRSLDYRPTFRIDKDENN